MLYDTQMSKHDRLLEAQNYATPMFFVEAVIPYFEKWLSKFQKPPIVWCPFDKKQSPFVECLKKYRKEKKIILRYSHITDKENGDFFQRRSDFKCDLIISNPPFDRKIDLIKRLSELKKDYCILFPLDVLSNKVNVDAFISSGLEVGGLIIPNRRISYDSERPRFKSIYVCSEGFLSGVEFIDVKDNTGKNFQAPSTNCNVEETCKNERNKRTINKIQPDQKHKIHP